MRRGAPLARIGRAAAAGVVATAVAVVPALSSAAADPQSRHAAVYAYPAAPRSTHVDHYFGTAVADPYRWLEDSTSARTKRWVGQESALTRTYLDSLPTLPQRTRQMRRLLDFARVGTPTSRGDLRFWTYNPGLAAQATVMVSDAEGGNARPLVDPAGLSADGTVSVPDWAPNWQGTTLAWTASQSGSDWRTMHFTDVATGAQLPDALTNVRFTELAWAPDGLGIYYCRYPAGQESGSTVARDQQVYFHRLGTPQADDVLVYEVSPDFSGYLKPEVSPATNRLWITEVDSERRHGLLVKDLSVADAPVTRVLRNDGRLWLVQDTTAGPIIATDREAPRNRIVKVLLADPAPHAWQELVPEGEGTIRSTAVAGDHLVVASLVNATSRVDVYDHDGSHRRTVALPGLGAVTDVESSSGPGPAYFAYSSFAMQPTVFALDGATAHARQWAGSRQSTASGASGARVVTTQEWVRSKDGTQVPIFLTRRADVRADGTNPTLLFGYGGFNIPVLPEYQPFVRAWVERGGVYVSATLRGGSEFGAAWHKAGMKLLKQNVFDDFIASAEWLIAHKWTTSHRLAIAGRSNGGLLVGAAMTQRPELFGAALPIVGVMDMLRYQEFTVGSSWASEYGSSADSAEMFRYLLGYSPLHSLRPGTSYPATMVMTAEHDDRVVPAHSYKFAATLQHDNANTRPMLIRIASSSGHGGGSSGGGSVAQDISDSADRLAFLDANIGGKGPRPVPVFRAR